MSKPFEPPEELSLPDPIDEANARKRKAIQALQRAHAALCEAQNFITDVEGEGSAQVYDDIAGAYQDVAKLRRQVVEIRPTGIFV